jgi:DNA-directed RNA polymerase III subunit RPC8|tara:strand:+ start:184 stop:864 length:681 start_codon:yes stop_codon:yes gene_type:complete
MYLLSVMEDKLSIPPSLFDLDPTDVLIEEIEKKYVNKVVLEVGLCVAFYDIVEVGKPHVYPAEGSAHQVVKFRIVVFKPFVGEVCEGHIDTCFSEGITLSMGDFFADIHVTKDNLPSPSSFSPVEGGQWQWHSSDEDTNAVTNYDMKRGLKVRFKVIDCIFTLVTNSKRETRVTSTSTSQHSKGGDDMDLNNGGNPVAMKILGSMSMDVDTNDDASYCLGGINWWR